MNDIGVDEIELEKDNWSYELICIGLTIYMNMIISIL